MLKGIATQNTETEKANNHYCTPQKATKKTQVYNIFLVVCDICLCLFIFWFEYFF